MLAKASQHADAAVTTLKNEAHTALAALNYRVSRLTISQCLTDAEQWKLKNVHLNSLRALTEVIRVASSINAMFEVSAALDAMKETLRLIEAGPPSLAPDAIALTDIDTTLKALGPEYELAINGVREALTNTLRNLERARSKG